MTDTRAKPHSIDESRAPSDTVLFDFRRPDRIPKSLLTSIQFLHEHFVRAIVSTLTVYLRSFVSGSLVGAEQFPYGEFVDSLASPTCVAYMTMQPYEGFSLLELGPSLVAPILELVLGGDGKRNAGLDRDITEVEESMMDGVFGILVHDLVETWKSVAPVAFTLDAIDSRPQRSNRLSRNAAVVVIAVELSIAEHVGVLHLVIPSAALKLMHQRFDQHWAVHKCGSYETEIAIRRRMSRELALDADCDLPGARIRLGELQSLKVGDVVSLGIPADSQVTVTLSGKPKFKAAITPIGARMAVTIESTEAG